MMQFAMPGSTSTKSGASPVIHSLLCIGPFVFTVSGGRPVTAEQPAKERMRKAMGIEPTTLHNICRSIAPGLRRLGVPDEPIEGVLGYKRAGVAGADNRIRHEAEQRVAMEKWAGHVESLVA
jgi:hypothetical protein